MKHHLLRVILLLLLTIPVLHADMKQKKIVVSSFTTVTKAQRALDKLEEYIDTHPDIIALLQENNIELTNRPSGNYHIVVIEPFSDKEALAKVKEVLSKQYDGFFTNNYTAPAATETISTVSYANHIIEVKTPNEPAVETDIEEVYIEEVITEKPAVEELIVEAPAVEIQIASKSIAEAPAINATISQESIVKTITTEELLAKESLSATTMEATPEPTIETMPEPTIETMPEPTIEPALVQKPSEKTIKDTELAVKGNNTAENSFINHSPSQEADSHDSFLPPWWVLLSVLALILVPVSSYIENRNKRHYY